MSSETSLEKGIDPAQATKEQYVEDRRLEKSDGGDDDYHIHNDLAFKGDDSDGKVEWTTRSIIAAMTLGALYTGSYFEDDVSNQPLTLF